MATNQTDRSSIDLRSDTVTLPSAEMRRAMFEAELGDDVIDVDPTVHQLELLTAEVLGKEAAIFVPSGTMSNQIGIRVHCSPGDEMICEEGCHIYNYEQGAFAQLSGIVARTVIGDQHVLSADQLRGMIRSDDEHLVRTRLICLENTHNRGGGCVLPYENLQEVCRWAHDNSLRTHLDGARLFNAVVASKIAARKWAAHFDTVSVCFSKGLGAPVGSALAGTAESIRQARRHRKLFGGGMRQSGIIAAGALFALQHHVDRLEDDHRRAQRLADLIDANEGLSLDPLKVDTNIVIFKINKQLSTAGEFVKQLSARGVQMLPFSDVHVRAVTHLGISDEDIESAARAIGELAGNLQAGSP